MEGPGSVRVLDVVTRSRVSTEHVRTRGPSPVLREGGREIGRRLELGAREPRAVASCEPVLRIEVSEVMRPLIEAEVTC